MADGVALINISIAVAGGILSVAALLSVAMGPKIKSRQMRYFFVLFLCMAIICACNILGHSIKGMPGNTVRAILYISNFGEFFFTSFLVFRITMLLIDKLNCGREGRVVVYMINILQALQLALLIFSQFNGLCYIIDANNMYRRTNGYALIYLFPFLTAVMAVHMLIAYGNRLSDRDRRAFWLCVTIPSVAMCIQVFLYGVQFINLALSIAVVALYVMIIKEQRDRYYKQIEINKKLETEILLSQIQPHFLYNTLAVIRELSLEDGVKGAKAIEGFSEYLRHNMESINQSRPVPFERELRHTQNYIALQQLRFDKELSVTYDIDCSRFLIPSLILQPIVENAVRYGVRKKENGDGQIVISTKECPDRFEVTVEDNGPGFDVNAKLSDDRMHVGLENVRQRLDRISGGRLLIDSVIGEGTTVKIQLPKNG